MSSFPQEHIDLTRVPLIYRMTSKLPLAILHAMSSVVWPILFYLVRYRRATVTRNLEQAFPDMTPAEFVRYRELGLERGFLEVVAGPMVRSSYRADRVLEKNNAGISAGL